MPFMSIMANPPLGKHLGSDNAPVAQGPRPVLRAASVVQSTVMNPRGQRLGEIKDVVIDAAAGQVAYVVLAFGDLPLRREKWFALPWQAFQQSKGLGTFLLAGRKGARRGPGLCARPLAHTRAAPQWRREVAEHRWEQATRGSVRSRGRRAMPASVWEWPRDRKESRSLAQTLSHGAEVWRLSASCRAPGLHRHAPRRSLLVPVATIMNLRHTVRHGPTP